MSVESCIHKSLNVALKVHQIDAFNFNLKKKIFPGCMPPDPPIGCEVISNKTGSHG